MRLTRRDLLRLGGAGLAAALSAACGAGGTGSPVAPESGKARLGSRPGAAPLTSLQSGAQPLGLGFGSKRDGVLYVPPNYSVTVPAPLLLMLHGSGGTGGNALGFLESFADRAGFLVLSPDSRGHTWDAITDEFGPDVTFIDRALTSVFAQCSVDPDRVATAGFSDGATYSLALARSNGDLFSRGIAFSPGFLLPVSALRFPRLFVSHGTGDRVIPIDDSSRTIVPELREAGYRVRYREFYGGHEVPPAIVRDAVRWSFGAKV